MLKTYTAPKCNIITLDDEHLIASSTKSVSVSYQKMESGTAESNSAVREIWE